MKADQRGLLAAMPGAPPSATASALQGRYVAQIATALIAGRKRKS
jgi:hypothetical protein